LYGKEFPDLQISGLPFHPKKNIDNNLKIKLEKLENDKQFIQVIGYGKHIGKLKIKDSNELKLSLIKSFLSKSPYEHKIMSINQVGYKEIFTETFITIKEGMPEITIAYYGDYTGSNELQQIQIISPTILKLGFYKKGNFVELKQLRNINKCLYVF